jgi:PTS system nitrogen regulatory IIA component
VKLARRAGNLGALPHARIEGLDRYFGMFARLNRPIHFDSVDPKPVDLVFLLLTPAGENDESNALTQSRQMPGHFRVARRVRRLMTCAGRLARPM